MSGEIADQCRQYVAEHAAEHDGESEDAAIESLCLGFRRFAKSQGWDDADFHVNVEQLAKNGLRQHRNS